MLREKHTVIRRAMIVFDGAIVLFTFVAAYFLRQNFHLVYKFDLFPSSKMVSPMSLSPSEYLILMIFVIPMWCGSLYWHGMYRSVRTKTFLEILWIIIKASILTAFAFAVFVFLFKLKFVSRLFFLFFIMMTAFFLLLEKYAMYTVIRIMRKQGYNFKRILVVGISDRAARFIEKINSHPEWGLKVSGVMDYEEHDPNRKVGGVDVIGKLDDMEAILRRDPIDEVVFIVPRTAIGKIENALYICETIGVKTNIAVDLFELKIAKARQTDLEGIPLLTFETFTGPEWQLFIKRALDIILSGLGLIILGPLLIVVAAVIRITSPGPVLFLQKRVGLNGRTFVMYKFRTMQKGAHERLAEFRTENMMKGPVFKIKNDPRVTSFGKFLRKFSIDELPQLVNVFVGHMSLVGPRPPIHKEVAQYEPWQRRRLSMRPGLTCIWQISGRNRVDFDEWMKLDLEYIDNWSLWLDFKILMKTIPVVLFGIGAY